MTVYVLLKKQFTFGPARSLDVQLRLLRFIFLHLVFFLALYHRSPSLISLLYPQDGLLVYFLHPTNGDKHCIQC